MLVNVVSEIASLRKWLKEDETRLQNRRVKPHESVVNEKPSSSGHKGHGFNDFDDWNDWNDWRDSHDWRDPYGCPPPIIEQID
jgi:hypothetical protein